jgi:hypothetical protein
MDLYSLPGLGHPMDAVHDVLILHGNWNTEVQIYNNLVTAGPFAADPLWPFRLVAFHLPMSVVRDITELPTFISPLQYRWQWVQNWLSPNVRFLWVYIELEKFYFIIEPVDLLPLLDCRPRYIRWAASTEVRFRCGNREYFKLDSEELRRMSPRTEPIHQIVVEFQDQLEQDFLNRVNAHRRVQCELVSWRTSKPITRQCYISS